MFMVARTKFELEVTTISCKWSSWSSVLIAAKTPYTHSNELEFNKMCVWSCANDPANSIEEKIQFFESTTWHVYSILQLCRARI